MPTKKLIGGTIITDDDPLQVRLSGGATTTPKNASVSVAATSTELIGAATETSRSTLIRNTGDRTIYIAFGEEATTAEFPLAVGETLKTDSMQAVNAITATGTGTAFVLAEASE